MNSVRQKAKQLLESGAVKLVLGYEAGSEGKARPAFIMNANDTDKLIYQKGDMINLAVYLNKHEVKKFDKIAVVASLAMMKSIFILSSEKQIDTANVTILGVNQNEELIEFANIADVEKYINENPVEYTPEEKAILEKIDAMTMEERWKYWTDIFSKCIKCYACRASCPMCYCTRCTVDNNQPQWITVAPTALGNMEWHMMRAMHLAGRCSGCGNCDTSCPVNIPLNLINLKLTETIHKQFGFTAGALLTQEYVMSTFKTDDKENFIK
ncbi:MAG: 4Fe-4S dicluster domain-containing protein [Bacteroidota bacterium]